MATRQPCGASWTATVKPFSAPFMAVPFSTVFSPALTPMPEPLSPA